MTCFVCLFLFSAASSSIKRRFTFTASDGASTSVPLSVNRWALDFAVLPEIVSSTDSQTAGELVTVTGRHFGPRVNPVVNFVQIGGEVSPGGRDFVPSLDFLRSFLLDRLYLVSRELPVPRVEGARTPTSSN